MGAAAPALALTLLVAGVACGAESGSDSDRSTLTQIVLEAKDTQPVSAGEVDLSIEVMRRRLDKLRVSEASLKRDGEKIELMLPDNQVDQLLSVLLRPGRFEFFDLQGDLATTSLDSEGFPRPSVKPLSPSATTVVVSCGTKVQYCPGVAEAPKRTYYYLFTPTPRLTGTDIEPRSARADVDPLGVGSNEPFVALAFTREGARKFQVVTRELAKRGREVASSSGEPPEYAFQQFAIVLDHELLSAPAIDFNENPDGIPGDNGMQITGISSRKEAREIALVLQTGTLPAEFEVVSKENVDN